MGHRQRMKRGVGFAAGGVVLTGAAIYFAFSRDYGWLYALLFTGLPGVFALVVGVRELVLAGRDTPSMDD